MTDIPLPKEVKVIGPSLDKATFLSRQRAQWSRKPTEIYASSLYLECNRQLVGGIIGWEAKEHSLPQWLRNADTGSSMHSNYQALMGLLAEITEKQKITVRVATTEEVLQHAGLTIDNYKASHKKRGLPKDALELPLPIVPERITGRGDGIFRIDGSFTWEIEEAGDVETRSLSFNNELVVVEIKTVKHKDWTGMHTKSSNKYKKYYAQMQAYMHFYHIRRCLLFVVNRNDDTIREFLIEYDPEFMARKLAQVAEAWAYVDNGKVPPAKFDQYGDCLFCPFKSDCDLEEMLSG